jgi:hypothetical protein
VFSENHRHCPSTTGKVVGAAGGDEFEPSVAQQGKKEEAQRMLAKIYGWFTEGFDIADLKEAKALLEDLSA